MSAPEIKVVKGNPTEDELAALLSNALHAAAQRVGERAEHVGELHLRGLRVPFGVGHRHTS